jgi:hypothetical protein
MVKFTNFSKLFPPIHCNLLEYFGKYFKRIFIAIGAILTFASPQKLQKGGRHIQFAENPFHKLKEKNSPAAQTAFLS